MSSDGLGSFALAVMLSVMRLDDDAYGARLRSDVSAALDRDCAMGAVHVTLTRLAARGFLRTWMSEPTPVRGGRARRQYAVTPAGRAAVRQALRVESQIMARRAAWLT